MDHRVLPANTPCLRFLRKRSPDGATPNLLLIYQPQRDERLSWPGWLTCSRRFTHISGHPSATGKVCRPKTDVLRLCHETNQWMWLVATAVNQLINQLVMNF